MNIWDLVLRANNICSIEGEGNEGGGAGAGGEGSGTGTGSEGGEGGEGGGEGGEGSGANKPEVLTREGIAAIVAQQMGPLHEKNGELTSEIVNLRAQLRSQGQQPPREVRPEIVAEPKIPKTKEEFLDKMNADPVGTILSIINETVNPRIDEKVKTATSGTRAEIDARDAFMREAEADRQQALEIATTYEGDLREEMNKLADTELRKIAATRGGRYLPGDLETAAMRVDRKMRAAGKQPNAGQGNGNGNGNGNGDGAPRFPRNPRSSTGAGNGSGDGGAGSPPTVAKTIDDLVTMGKLTKDEAEGARRNNKKWGIDDATFIKNWNEAAAVNPRFGTGV